MYTVVLYLEDEKISIDKYKFIFFSLQEDNKIYLCPWKKDTTAEEIVNILNEVTYSHQEWKLILFGGMCQKAETYLEEELKEDVKRLMRCYTGNGTGNLPEIKGHFPERVYCIVCGNKSSKNGQMARLVTVDNARQFGSNFRMFWFEVDMSCEKNKFYDWFRLNCILLILAVNHIPSGVLEYGYLYHLDIDIDSECFGRYVQEQETCLTQVGQYLASVGDNLQRARKMGNGYPEETTFHDTLEECRKSMRESGNLLKLKRKELRHPFCLEGKLEKNRREVHARLFFPKGMLRKEAARIQEMVGKKKGTDEFLSAAGEDMLERREWEKLEEICKKRRVPLKQTEYEQEYEEREAAVRQCAQKKMVPLIKYGACAVLSILETFVLGPFLYYSVHTAKDSQKNVLYQIMEFLKLDNLPWAGFKMLITWGIMCLVCMFAIVVLVFLLSMGKEFGLLYRYHKHIQKNIVKRQKQRIQYYEDIVNLLADYQYCIRMLQEQRMREENWEKKRIGLQFHRNAWKQNSHVCRQLKFFTEPEENDADLFIAAFDIQEDPRQIEYYWTPFKESPWKAELNRSGLFIRGIFNFITRIHITKSICYGPLPPQ